MSMNQPFGCDQCRILDYLTNAAEALDNDQSKLAKSFVRRARDTHVVKQLIMRKASQGFREAGAKQARRRRP